MIYVQIKFCKGTFILEKHINLDDLFGGIFFSTKSKNQKKFNGNEIIL